MGQRRAGRELALQILYARDAGKQELRETLRGFREGVEADQRTREFAEALVQGVEEHRDAIDAAITARSKNWSLSRMPRVDLNVMRLAAFELLFRSDIPKKVSINEAIEIAKKYGDKESPAFVNGILDELDACPKDEERSTPE
ncbi:transcription antitermination factor NusB [Trichlorobacter ammonificans]|uniref:Transcription antitermination protein NusB n=1 Tax=Trichlorobacter ammonificans TaxID=2916410 RepID=A0ABM9DA29_9BACT|nr:transcription antitermination factor NusB [Trichlorobacter ammonificans]CAH2032065.1 Transcription antitermination protein NusB [Trichlorobacter ammonificans]